MLKAASRGRPGTRDCAGPRWGGFSDRNDPLRFAYAPGIAVASVTGTDMPAAGLVVVVIYFLARSAEKRPHGPAKVGTLQLGPITRSAMS